LKKIFVIVGPTASGKTSVGIELAEILNAEIISADSRQVYKGISIASASPSESEMQGIRHHFISEISPETDFNAGEFAKLARERINTLLSNGKNALIVGGSGLYIKALIDGFFEAEIDAPEIRKTLYERMEKEGKPALFEELQTVDPESAKSMDATKFRRVIRALEVYHSTGIKISELQKTNDKPDFTTIQAGLLWDRKELYHRINSRVDKMLSDGLISEIKALLEQNYHYSTHKSLNTVGVKEVMKYLENTLTYDEMVTQIKQNSRRYAKRQMTWFRKDKRINWVDITPDFNPKIVAENIHKIYFS
jgi:tRNA dimethylallyltransferase